MPLSTSLPRRMFYKLMVQGLGFRAHGFGFGVLGLESITYEWFGVSSSGLNNSNNSRLE